MTSLLVQLYGTYIRCYNIDFSFYHFKRRNTQNLSTLSILICCGLLSSIQQFLLAFSRSLAPAVILAPFQYLSIPFAYIVGIYIFDEDLGLNFIIGTLIIILATFYLNLKTKLN